MTTVRLLTLDPGHFHAALVQKELLPGVAPTVHVYAPLGPDLLAHLARIAAFNGRAENPTAWHLEVHTGDDFLERALREKPGDVVVLAGRNRDKIRRIHAALDAGLHVLADKPWTLVPEDLPMLAECVRLARQRGLVATDILTERYEVTSIRQRQLVNAATIFGSLDPGTPDDPGVVMESVHGLIKTVAGAPLRRPGWFFDVDEQGEALTDVGIHLVDLVQWIVRPEGAFAVEEIAILDATRWPTELTRDDFERITGSRDFPPWTADYADGDRLNYPGNNRIRYVLGGVHVRLDVRWDRECQHGDTHFSRFRGSRASVEVRQGPEENYRPEVVVVPRQPGDSDALRRDLESFLGTSVDVCSGPGFRVPIAESERVGHEAHFAHVARQFLRDLANPVGVPIGEDVRTLARYHVTTHGVTRARGRA